jgi:hypothetical protein
MTTQRTQGQSGSLIGFLFILSLVVFAAGCGEGSDSGGNNSGDNPPQGDEQTDVVAGPVGIVTLDVNDSSGNPLSESARTVTLDGSNSHAGTTKPDTYSWKMNSKPPASQAVLLSNNGETTSFVADKKGTYVVQLIVTSGGVSSERTITIVDAKNDGELFVYNHTGLNPDCVVCHDGVKQVNIKGEIITVVTKIGDHMATGNKCAACHSTLGFLNVPFVDHEEVFGKCSECHNGVVAITKSQFHQETTGECDECHNTRSFVDTAEDGSYDHSGIDRACTACHNGTVAIGKFEGHIETTADCGFCHTTETFQNAYVDHSGFKESGQLCAGCHDGSTDALGTPDNHPDMPVDCRVCHDSDSNPLTFHLPDGIFDHGLVDSISQPCGVCHDGVFAIGTEEKLVRTGVAHDPITSDCRSCHNTVAFTPAFEFDHSNFPTVTGDRCDRCHGNGNTGMDANHITIGDGTVNVDLTPDLDVVGVFPALDCANCHTPGTFTSGVFDHAYLDNPSVYSTKPGCSTCHDEIHAVGKPPNHIDTTDECDTCHTTDTFSGATIDHTDPVIADGNNCASCHNGDISIGKPTGNGAHVPTDKDCSACHVPYPDTSEPDVLKFAPSAQFDHVNISSQRCDTCHSGTFSNVPGKMRRSDPTATPPTVAHIPTQEDCDVCHSTGDTFVGATNFQHPDYAGGGCEGCHNGRFTTNSLSILSKSNSGATNGHVPTEQDCDTCHANTNDWSQLKAPSLQHAGITSGCYTCHNVNGDYADNGALGVADDTDPTNGVHPTITVSSGGVHTPDCVTCHSAPSARNPDMTFATHYTDHTNLTSNCTQSNCHIDLKDFALSAQHLGRSDGNDCELCHVGGGTWTEALFDHSNVTNDRRCDSCHDGNNATGTDAKPNHVPLNNGEDCRECHNTTAFAGAKFNHEGIETGCIDCHDGDIAPGKPQNHVPTNDDCYVCHETTGFIPGTFDHTNDQISGKQCQDCHDGVFAIGTEEKLVRTGVAHDPITSDCGACHSTDSFVPAFNFDHSNIGNQSCSSSDCHGGDEPTSGHIDSGAYGLDCDNCHVAGGTFTQHNYDHNNIGNVGDGTCQQCHGDNIGNAIGAGEAPSQPDNHFEIGSGVDCDACHTTNGWSDQGTFDHCPDSTGNSTFDRYNQCDAYPGDHLRNGQPRFACTKCHNTNQATVIRYTDNSSLAPACAGCHANDYSNNNNRAHAGRGVSGNKECGNASGCHRVTGGGFD